MQLSKFTDYALRVLMYISRPRDLPYTIAEIAQDLHVSQNHLVKIVHFMGKQNWIATSRGKGGGIRLNCETLQLRVGDIVRVLQGEQSIVECQNPPCVLLPQCGLKGILNHAAGQFYQSLNQYTLDEVVRPMHSPSQNKILAIPLLNV